MYWIYIELFYVYIYFHQFLYGWMLVQRYWFHIDTLIQVVVYQKYNNMWGEKETMKKGEHNHVDKPKRSKHGMMKNRRCK
jgi:hypothetical protein